MNDLAYLEKKRAELKAQQEEIDRQIETAKAQEEQVRHIALMGLHSRIDSMIKTSSSSFSDISMGEVIEYGYEPATAEEFSRTIDVEISGRYREIDGDSVHSTNVSHLTHRAFDDPTLVVSYLIPYELVKNDPFFKENEK